ncbi:MAG: deoxynucleoside kinase [Gemmatimonadaceae bacterium]
MLVLAIAGMVGAGKTTLTRALAGRFGLQLSLESVDGDNPWLERFYGGPNDMRRYGLSLQLHFLATRFQSVRKMRGQGGAWILDRTWYEDAEIFARGLHDQGTLTSDEWGLYLRLYTELLHSPAAKPPRLLIYLYAPVEVMLDRIATRGRPKERDTPAEYWIALHERYERWIAGFRHCPVMRLDVREYDLIADPTGIDVIAQQVRRRLEPELPQVELF